MNVHAPAPTEGPAVALKRVGPADLPTTGISPAEVRQQLGSGAALSDSWRRQFEPRFGADLGSVRVHTDAAAGRVADSLGAKALTAGEHVAFAAGEFAPGTATGDQLLAHEVAHVIQGRNGGLGTGVVPRLHPAEAQADRAAMQAVAGRSVGSLGAGRIGVGLTRREITSSSGATLSTRRIGQGPGTNHCGPTSTANILRYLGYEFERDDVVRATQSWTPGGGVGSSQFTLIQFLATFDVPAEIWNENDFSHIRANIDAGIPMIAAIDSAGTHSDHVGTTTHYVVIDGYDDSTPTQIHITDPGNHGSSYWTSDTSGGWDAADTPGSYDAWAAAFWQDMILGVIVPTRLHRSFITVGAGGVGGQSRYHVTPNLQVADAAGHFVRSLSEFARAFDSAEAFFEDGPQALLRMVFSLVEGLAGAATALPGLVREWGSAMVELGQRMWNRGGVGDILGGALLMIGGAPIWLAGAIVEVLGNLVARFAELLLAPFRWFLDWIGRDDAVRDMIGRRILDGTIEALNDSTVTWMLNELMSGFCSGDDERSILSLLRAARDAQGTVGTGFSLAGVLTPDMRRRLYSAVDGAEYIELVELIALHMGDVVREEAVGEIISGVCGDDKEEAIMRIVRNMADDTAGRVLANAELRRRIYSAVDGQEFTDLMGAWFIRFPAWRTEILLRVFDTSVGDARERMLIDLVRTQVDAVRGTFTPYLRQRLYDCVDGAEFDQLIEIVVRDYPEWRLEAIDRLLTESCGGSRERMLLRRFRALDEPALDAIFTSASRRTALYSAFDGDEYQALCRLMGTRTSLMDVRVSAINDLIRGSCGDDDEDSILYILRNVDPPTRAELVRRVGRGRLDSAIDGEQQDQLDALLGPA